MWVLDTGGGGVLRVQQRDGGMLGAGERRGSKASLRGNRNSWSQPCWERAAVGVIVEGVVGLRSWHPLFGVVDGEAGFSWPSQVPRG